MLKHFAVRAVFVLLVGLAAVVGAVHAAPAHAAVPLALFAPAQTTPGLKVEAYGGLAHRGVRRGFYFRVQADGPVTVKATLRVKGRLALGGTMTRVSPVWNYRDTWKPKAISKTFPGLVYYTYCVVATDSLGNSARHCARFTVV